MNPLRAEKATHRAETLSAAIVSCTRVLLAVLLLLLGGCTDAEETGEADRGEQAVPRLTALENEFTATVHETPTAVVHRIDLPAEETIGPHEGGDRVIYSLSSYTLQYEEGETEGTERSFAPGEVHFHAGGVHSVTNTGTETASYLVFERSSTEMEAVPPAGETLDAVSISEGARHEVMLENDQTVVHRVALDPGTSLPPHFGYPRIVYALSDYTLTFIDADTDTTTERSFSEGDLHDHGAGMHQVENTGDSPAEYLVVAFKR